ncbi:hypothetical protein QUB10_12375 [Microcoleus sp. B5-D4]|uniref:hypothetical protein n=1 Tax=unclassified Microcoleus TaxID=2642155 RepID=UPI002FD31B53
MPLSADCPNGRSQLLMFPRRELLQKIASAALLFFVPRSQSGFENPKKYPAPKFCIGNKVADHWTDELNQDSIEYGEVLGICWHPYEQDWTYLISWTSGEMPDSSYPCFDEHLTVGGDLRLVSHD